MIYSYDLEKSEELTIENSSTNKICEACGKKFISYGKRPGRLKFCNRIHYKICPVCNTEFKIDLSVGINSVNKTCSRKCSNILKKQSLETSMLEKYGVNNPSQMKDHRSKVAKTCLEKYGVESYSQSDEFKKRARAAWDAKTPEELEERYQKSIQTNRERYGVDNGAQSEHAKEKQKSTNRERYGVDWYRQTEECEQRIRETVKNTYGDEVYFRTEDYKQKIHEISLSKYGVDHFMQSDIVKENMRKANLEKHGVTCVLQRPDIRKKAMKRTSSLEIRLHNFLENYHVEYITEYLLHNGEYSHHFDAFLPKYNMLIDVDGVYFHAYIEDPDGQKSRDDYDDVRLHCVPTGYIYMVLVESDFERELRRLQKTLQLLDVNLFDYDSELFKWCRQIGFPYYNYTDEYLYKQYSRLHECVVDEYRPSCEFGISIINQFHRSMFNCRVGNHVSVYDAWQDDKLLKKTIANRLIYQNTVNPSKILSGFNISKIAPKVSIFNPVLSKYLIHKYLDQYSTIFDPFSGFSGRLLGAAACDKQYTGSDIREVSVIESNQIIEFLHLNSCSVHIQDIIEAYGTYECLLTCPPYGNKEIYIENQLELNEDSWIDICLDHFKCKQYLFVVGHTDKYKHYIVEELKSKSHFRKNCEYVVLI